MRFFLPAVALAWACVLFPQNLPATSIVPFTNLGEAALYSECVVLARAVETLETTENGTVFRETRFESIELTKGTLQPGSSFMLRPLSRRRKGMQLDITGDFKPEIGKTYLLFLYQSGSFWRPLMLSYYVFEQFQQGDDAYLVPIGAAGIETVERPDGQAVEPLGLYLQESLLPLLRTYTTAPQNGWNSSAAVSNLGINHFQALERAVPNGCDFTLGGPHLCRWQNAAIPISYDNTANPAGWGGTFSNVLGALNDHYTGIDPSDAGPVDYDPDCGNGSAIEGNFTDFCDLELNGPQCALIIFDDPCNEIGDLNNCAGTLAFGGSYSSSTNHQFDGQSWDDALYGFVVVNNGTPGCLTATQFEQVMTHELTHVYRMGHLSPVNFPNQNMNPSCCSPINFKDEECMNYAYPAPAPVELLSFDAKLQGQRQVKLQWATGSERENAFFTLERSPNGIQYEEVQKIQGQGTNAGSAYEWLDIRPLEGINYYRLSQTDFSGQMERLGIRAVTVGHNTATLALRPNPVSGDALQLTLNLDESFQGNLEVMGADGKIWISEGLELEKGIQTFQQPVSTLPAGVYLLRLHDGQQQWSLRLIRE